MASEAGFGEERRKALEDAGILGDGESNALTTFASPRDLSAET